MGKSQPKKGYGTQRPLDPHTSRGKSPFAKGPAKIFSGGGSKSGLQAKLTHHYGGEAHEEIMGTPLQEDITSEGGPHKSGGPADPKTTKHKENPGFNFMPPTNPKPKNELIKGDTHGGSKTFKNFVRGGHVGGDLGSQAYDWDQDGDSVLRDYNQDGTMVGRGIKAVSNWLKKK